MELALILLALVIAGGGVVLYRQLNKLAASNSDGSEASNADEIAMRDRRIVELETRLENAQAQADDKQATIAAREDELREARVTIESQNTQIAKLTTQSQAEQKAADEKIAQMQQQLAQFNEKMESFLKSTARDILTENTRHLKNESKESLEQMLKPLDDNLKTFRARLDTLHTESAVKNKELTTKIETLFSQTSLVAESADNLSKALKGDKKLQGQWGELQLKTLLESAGLVEGADYKLQHSAHSKDGKQQFLDCVIFLPQKKCLIIDAKVSLVAYERSASAASVDDESEAMKEHIASVRSHIRGLSGKEYHDAKHDGHTVDFVLLFMPLEPAFMAALKHTPDLYREAYEKKIILTSPTTLLPILKTVAYLWTIDKQQKHAEAIADEGKKLYDKICGFMDSMADIGTALQKTNKAYNTAAKQLSEGSGNLKRRAEKLGSMGVAGKSDKLPPDLPHIE